jgi:hypothetical protein
MKTNSPYTYLRKIDAGAYEMSTVVQPNAGKSYIENGAGLSVPMNVPRVLKLAEQAGGGARHEKIYAIQNIGQTGKEAHVRVAFGPAPELVNTCKLFFADYQDAQAIPNDRRYLPHLYLQSHNMQREFTIFGAIFQAENFKYTMKVVDAGPNRMIHIMESESERNPPGYWEFENTYDGNIDGTVEVIVIGADATAKGKGKVRHSVADNKPFF